MPQQSRRRRDQRKPRAAQDQRASVGQGGEGDRRPAESGQCERQPRIFRPRSPPRRRSPRPRMTATHRPASAESGGDGQRRCRDCDRDRRDRGSGFSTPANVADLYSRSAASFYNAKKFDGAAARSSRPSRSIRERRSADQSCRIALLAGPQAGRGRAVPAGSSRPARRRPEARGSAVQARCRHCLRAEMPVATDIARQWIAAYPSPASWRNALAIYQNLYQPDVEGTLDALRLMHATGAVEQRRLQPVCAAPPPSRTISTKRRRSSTRAGGKLIDPASPLFRDIITGLKPSPRRPKPTSPKRPRRRRAAWRCCASATAIMRWATMRRRSSFIARRWASPASIPASPICISAWRWRGPGDKAGATTAFNAVSGPHAEIAKFWLIYVQQKA